MDVILGRNKVEKVKMLVFKNATNPCMIGRDVLATHPDAKHHFESLMGAKETTITSQNKCKTYHNDRISDDDHDEMDDLLSDNANTKLTTVDESIHTKVPVSMDRNMCKTKINNSIEKRTSTIENV